MSEPIKISTQKYIKNGKVNIDGHVWEAVVPGAGTELRFSQASRASKLWEARMNLLNKKIEAGTVTEEELDRYEEYKTKYEQNERDMYDIFTSTFRDDTPDNSEVKKWIDETPSIALMLAFDEFTKQANSDEKEEKADGAEEKPEAKKESA